MDKINKLYLSTTKGDSVLYVINDFFSKNKKQQQINLEEDKILDLLSKIGLFKILSIETDKVILRNKKNKIIKRSKPLIRTYQLQIDREKLDDLNYEFKLKSVKKIPQPFSNIKEEIKLKNCGGIKINGKYISSHTRNSKKVFNSTEESFIYFLFNKPGQCFDIKILANELKTSSGYLKNRITNIHKILGTTISEKTPPKVEFIKNEKGRGYHLNIKILR